MAYATVNPATGETVKEFPTATDQEIKDAVKRSGEAYKSWRNTPVSERAQLMHKMAELYRERKEELAKILTDEMGKPKAQAIGEVMIVAGIYDYYADNAEGFMEGRTLEPSTGGEARVVLDSTGSLLGIMPWNFPYYQVARFAAPNVMLGNTILLKHAGNVPQSAVVQEELFHEAGFPKDVYINIFASNDQIADIVIPDPAVQGVSLTGSERAGASVAATAGKNLKKVVLELGGSDPFIVLDDQNVERTVKNAVMGRMSNNGQACTNAKRFIVLEDAYESFVDKFAQAVQGIEPGDPSDDKTFLGPISTVGARDEIMEQVQDAIDKGASVLAGGKKIERDGAWMEATVLADVTPEMRAYAEEIFGPVAVVYKVKDADEAIELANSSPFGLGGSVFGADEAAALEIAKRVDSGMVFVNEVTGTAPDLPFGGVKRSGVGRELGPFGIEEFANKKLLHTPAKK
ncbi:succinate-semialdehyde dehydrogenase [Kocuria sp. WRN011]|uniref:NAD-dependent succinate-semialdehyde dehydrogenase n=2 Tax=Kocuria TaxID=57493 RepID=A0ABV3V1B6_9MICC|nr:MULTISPECIES: NAD-dependent succinate-semialdehyde dehydrogenase [Kocuria]MDN5699171.1 NAD-dependent succinate-semialdehyde dehydrogenase [Kocuria sp.]PBB08375.1 succinate-semialdehyde dehydrogenase [Kocuria sp. WRN011]PZP32151.1 MAG: NAD-dependent succinate-semialdehyde dehydrogenase [Kocuria rhizophila]